MRLIVAVIFNFNLGALRAELGLKKQQVKSPNA